MAAIDIAGFVSDLKDHAVDHGFHVHDERHFIESYSLRQWWEVDLHPEEACQGPLDLHLTLDVDPRTLLNFEELVSTLAEDELPPDEYGFDLHFHWTLPPLERPPDLLVLAADLAGIGGTALPVKVSATDSFHGVLEAAQRSVGVVGGISVSLLGIYQGEETMCDVLDRCLDVSRFLLEGADGWNPLPGPPA